MFLLCSSRKGIGSHQLHQTLDVTLKTARFMTRAFSRLCAKASLPGGIGGEGKFVEADAGDGTKNRAYSEKLSHHEPVIALVERKGRVASFYVPNVNASNLKPTLKKQISAKSYLRTDESAIYTEIGKSFASHEIVNQSAKEHVRDDAHTNTVETYFSILKRDIYCVYHHVSERNLKCICASSISAAMSGSRSELISGLMMRSEPIARCAISWKRLNCRTTHRERARRKDRNRHPSQKAKGKTTLSNRNASSRLPANWMSTRPARRFGGH